MIGCTYGRTSLNVYVYARNTGRLKSDPTQNELARMSFHLCPYYGFLQIDRHRPRVPV